MNKRLLKVAAYLGSQGLYKEAAQIKKLADPSVRPTSVVFDPGDIVGPEKWKSHLDSSGRARVQEEFDRRTVNLSEVPADKYKRYQWEAQNMEEPTALEFQDFRRNRYGSDNLFIMTNFGNSLLENFLHRVRQGNELGSGSQTYPWWFLPYVQPLAGAIEIIGRLKDKYGNMDKYDMEGGTNDPQKGELEAKLDEGFAWSKLKPSPSRYLFELARQAPVYKARGSIMANMSGVESALEALEYELLEWQPEMASTSVRKRR